MQRTIFFISDGTGITAETVGHTLLTQFEDVNTRQITLPFVTGEDKAHSVVRIINRAAEDDRRRPVIFSTLTEPKAQAVVAGANALVLDLFDFFIRPLEEEFQTESSHASGRSHSMSDIKSYQVRIDAMNFALQHDDGSNTKHYELADVVLVGVSRSGKTPTCVYLAMQFGIKAANFPLTPEDLSRLHLPDPLRTFLSRLFGLTIDPTMLQRIRSERRPGSQYASLAQCRREIREAETVFRTNRIPSISTTTISIEEIASRVLQETGLERRLY